MPYTRETIETEFKVERHTIVSPGKFEGQPRFTPYFAEKAESRPKTMFSVRDEDVAQFPELLGYKVVSLTKLDDGRITAQPFVSADFW